MDMIRRATTCAVLAVSTLTVVLGPSDVAATSCAWSTGYTWRTIADGTATLGDMGSVGDPYFDVYESVLVGEVVAIDGATDDPYIYPDGVSVTLDIIGAIRADSVEPTVVLHQGDMGEMMGYPFVLGRTYMVPLAAEFPDQVNLCMAIVEVSSTTAALALDIATESGLGVAVPTSDALEVESPTSAGAALEAVADTEESAGGPAVRALARWLGVALVVAVVAWVVRRRRDRSDHPC